MSPKVDVVGMYETACKFSDCSDFCMREQEKDGRLYLYTAPIVVNAAFACEIYLKLLLYLEKIGYKKEHELKELFDKLPPEIKETIEKMTVQRCGYWKNQFGMEVLSVLSNAFVEIRYIYERDWDEKGSLHLDTGYLSAFRDALRELCGNRLQRQLDDIVRGEGKL